ncbi:MAG: DNA-3-methyladenine glycosylase I [Alphaproteobacteria bacterium]
MNRRRCAWVDGSEIYKNYHDNEWGKPLHDDNMLFELLCLEGFQAGLSWITVLKKREDFCKAFDGFNPQVVASYDDCKVAELLQNEKIIRHKGKILAAINNARLFLEVQNKFGSFDEFIWGYVNGQPILNHFSKISEVPAKTELSERISKDLRKMGFKFVGATIIYSFMQAIGMVNDHTKDCFLYKE